jgi:hypothetical protein
MSTKVSLSARGIINSETQSYVVGCGGIESTQHLFMPCSIFGFGRWFDRGLVCRRWILKICQIIFYNSLFLQVVFGRSAPFYSLFGSYVFGSFGTKEINGYSEIQNCPLLKCWRRSNFTPTGSWRQQTLLLFLIIIDGGARLLGHRLTQFFVSFHL